MKRISIKQLRRKGRTPIRYRSEDGCHHGWIVKRGNKYLHVYLFGIGRRRLDSMEQRYVTEL